MPIVTFTMSLVTVAILWFGGLRIEDGYMQIGDFVALMQYATNILMYLLMAVFVMIYVPRARVCASRLNEVLDYEPEIIDGNSSITNKQLSLEFQNVSFSYADAQNPVLSNISFTCHQGQTTAIIGGTGSGKSTISKLIPRLLDTSNGQVMLNGINIKDLSQQELRNKIGFVPQKAFLFSGSIADNLRHGNDQADEQQLYHALDIAQATSFINQLDNKLDYQVSQGGKNFSGGQRQRLSIARMLVKKPDIYVFDDSFSALDFKTDAALRHALKDEVKDSIVITIAQRISTIMDADQIIVIDDGKVVNIGTHQELLNKCQVYLEIAKSQLSEKELATWI
jgi:ATP-binding cassette subfamily B protein